MKRRAFITLIGVAATAWPLAAQTQRVRRLGALMSNSEDDPLAQARLTALRQALAELGWAEGRNLKIEWRWTAGDITRVREYAAELVRLYEPEIRLEVRVRLNPPAPDEHVVGTVADVGGELGIGHEAHGDLDPDRIQPGLDVWRALSFGRRA